MEFEWDQGNQIKNLIKHGTTKEEAEQAFSNIYVLDLDENHSGTEIKFKLLGKTDSGKVLYIIFTARTNKIRVISARPADKGERKIYEEKT